MTMNVTAGEDVLDKNIFPQFHLLDATVVNVVGSPTVTVNHLLSMLTNDGLLE